MNTPSNERAESGAATPQGEVSVKLREMPLDHALRRANFAAVVAHSRAVRRSGSEERAQGLVLSAPAGSH